MHGRRKRGEREILSEMVFAGRADASERRPVKANGSWEGGLLHRQVLSEQVDPQED